MSTAKFGLFRISQATSIAIANKIAEFCVQPRPQDTSRTVALSEEVDLILRNVSHLQDGDFLLDFTKRKPNARGLDVSDDVGNDERVPLPPNTKPAVFTSAILDSNSGILVLHETSAGVSAAMMARYWQQLVPGVGRLRFDPVFEQRAVEQIFRTGAVSKFSLSLAHMGNLTTLRTLGLPETEITRLIQAFSAPSINITMALDSGSSSRTTLAVEKVRDVVSGLLGLQRRHLKKLSLVAENQEGQDVIVNFLKDRIIVFEELAPEERDEIQHEDRYRVTRSAWEQRKSELRERYRDAE